MSLVPTHRPLHDAEILTHWEHACELYRTGGLARRLAIELLHDLEAVGVRGADIDRVLGLEPDESVNLDGARRELDGEAFDPTRGIPVEDLPGNGRTGAFKGPYYLRGNEFPTQAQVAKIIGISQGMVSKLLNKGLSPDAILDRVDAGEIPKKRPYRRKKGGFTL